MSATPEVLIRKLLLGNAQVVAMVGNRCYHIERPQGSELPAFEFACDVVDGEFSLDGPESLTRVTAEVQLYSRAADDLSLIRKMVMASIDGYRGPDYGANIELCTFRQRMAPIYLEEPRIYAGFFELTVHFQDD